MSEHVEAGCTLDAMVAERVMGWHRRKNFWATKEARDFEHRPMSWSPSTDWVALGDVLDVFTEVGIALHCCRKEEWKDDKWKCIISVNTTEHGYVDARADSAHLAVCMAALKAVGAL